MRYRIIIGGFILALVGASLSLTTLVLMGQRSELLYVLYILTAVAINVIVVLVCSNRVRIKYRGLCIVLLGAMIGLIPYEAFYKLFIDLVSGKYGLTAYELPEIDSFRYWVDGFCGVFRISLIHISFYFGILLCANFLNFLENRQNLGK